MLIANPPISEDWGQELYLRETYGAASVGSGGEQFGVVYEKHKKQQPPMGSEALFARWWATVTDKAYVQPSTFQFAQAWVRAATQETAMVNVTVMPRNAGGCLTPSWPASSTTSTCRCYRRRSTRNSCSRAQDCVSSPTALKTMTQAA